jgi:uncharacterized protein (DUF362 family)
MPAKKSQQPKSVVAITKGGRWDAKKLLAEGFELIGGIRTIVKKGDTVLLKPNLGYPEAEGMPAWTCTTDYMVLAALTELCREAGAKRVITADGPVHGISGKHMFESTGIKAAVEKVGGEVRSLDEEEYLLRKVPGGTTVQKQWLPRICLDVDVIINVPKVKPTRVGKFTLGYKNWMGLVPEDERMQWHRVPEHFYFLVDLFRVLPPTFTVMDGLVIQEGNGPRFGTPVDWGVIIMGKDPVATETVTMQAIGHEPYEQMVIPIAAKSGQGTMDPDRIEVRGKDIEAVKRYVKVAPGDYWLNPAPNVQEHCGGTCWGCGLWIQYTPYQHEIDPKKKYAVVTGTTPRLPENFEGFDEVIVLGDCAIDHKKQIERVCARTGMKPQYISGCPPYPKRREGYIKAHRFEKLPFKHGVKRVAK